MKGKIVRWLGVCLAFLIVCFGVCACGQSGEVGKVKVLEKSENLVVIQVQSCENGATVYDALLYLKEKGELDFVSENSIYGQSLLSLNGKENPADWSYYWQFYTSNETQGNPDSTKTWGDYTLYYANFGISGALAEEGGIYLWEFAKSEW